MVQFSSHFRPTHQHHYRYTASYGKIHTLENLRDTEMKNFEAISWALSLKRTKKWMWFCSRDNRTLLDRLFELRSYKWKLYCSYFMIGHALKVMIIQKIYFGLFYQI